MIQSFFFMIVRIIFFYLALLIKVYSARDMIDEIRYCNDDDRDYQSGRIWEHKVSPAPLAKHIHVTGLARLD